ncbi:DUF4350 domain-containing protein [Phytomonospora endophytica]|uniref:DUF4350 domain-containing protein n=1 Tax=Phytomonospora endophytica TaxID=714109 RepID=A0A841G1V7_9ACTN|nr:DUF4350 domain-containing protein [Phytomonospora endophytica]MBB6039637.1 hypothetical protein [Phytomonospora endophytica]GIG65644.1 membrane protein [Phytomonospora endophytica]
MTTTTPPPETVEAAPAAKGPVKKKSRWSKPRLITPYAVVFLLAILTVIAVSVETPSPGDEDYLSPTATSDFGGSVLAQRLTERGIATTVATNVADALAAAGRPNTTLFVPAPDFVRADQLLEMSYLPEGTRIVLVRPGAFRLMALTGLQVADSRIATGLAEPGCNVPEAAAAGPAEVFRDRYAAPDPPKGMQPVTIGVPCYDGSMVTVPSVEEMPEIVVVGAADPFDNARINAAGNSELAVGMLATRPNLVWLDMHASEPPPKYDGEEQEPDPYVPPKASSPENPLYKAFPAWMWAALIGLLIVFALAALARGRRLGPPVVEPLPVQVPAAETVYGRARLYRRGDGREAALSAMRDGALHRILPAVGLSSKADLGQIVETVAARAGRDRQQVRMILFGPPPGSDQDLLNSIHALDSLEHAVLGERPHERRHRR